MSLPQVVSRDVWVAARKELLGEWTIVIGPPDEEVEEEEDD